jgi:hypothetical protein
VIVEVYAFGVASLMVVLVFLMRCDLRTQPVALPVLRTVFPRDQLH